jgi:hypothetical protein
MMYALEEIKIFMSEYEKYPIVADIVAPPKTGKVYKMLKKDKVVGGRQVWQKRKR